MKRYECPNCHARYHDEPAECPVCMWSNGGKSFMIEHIGPEAVTKAVAIENGYAGYNNCPHLCVDVPDGWFTISARLSDGRRVTFAFAPYHEDDPAQCVDIIYHDAKDFAVNGTRRMPMQNVVLFDRGNKTMVPPITTCTTLLLYDYEPVK